MAISAEKQQLPKRELRQISKFIFPLLSTWPRVRRCGRALKKRSGGMMPHVIRFKWNQIKCNRGALAPSATWMQHCAAVAQLCLRTYSTELIHMPPGIVCAEELTVRETHADKRNCGRPWLLLCFCTMQPFVERFPCCMSFRISTFCITMPLETCRIVQLSSEQICRTMWVCVCVCFINLNCSHCGLAQTEP